MTPEIKDRIEQIRLGNVPEGYQETILGIAPKVWRKSRIDEICRLSSGSTPRRDNAENFEGDILWITSGELKKRTITDTQEKISEEAAVSSRLEMYEPGTVVIAIYGLEAAGIRGTASIIGRRCTISQACMAFTQFQDVDNEFFYYWYLNNGQTIGLRYAQGTKQQNLSTDIVGAIPICVPSLQEQKKIAEILTTQDRIIELEQRKIEEIEKAKRYFLSKMFPKKGQRVPEIRFKGFTDDWEQRKLGELYTPLNERNEDLLPYSKTLSVSTMTYKEVGNGATDSSLSNYKRLRLGDIAFEGHTSKEFRYGRFVLNDAGDGIMSPRFSALRPISELPTLFWKYYIHYEPIMRKVLVNSTKAGTMMNELVVHEFLHESVLVPSIVEQENIGSFFAQLDHLITLHQRMLKEEKQKKKALMQLLLTGIVRVTV